MWILLSFVGGVLFPPVWIVTALLILRAVIRSGVRSGVRDAEKEGR